VGKRIRITGNASRLPLATKHPRQQSPIQEALPAISSAEPTEAAEAVGRAGLGPAQRNRKLLGHAEGSRCCMHPAAVGGEGRLKRPSDDVRCGVSPTPADPFALPLPAVEHCSPNRAVDSVGTGGAHDGDTASVGQGGGREGRVHSDGVSSGRIDALQSVVSGGGRLLVPRTAGTATEHGDHVEAWPGEGASAEGSGGVEARPMGEAVVERSGRLEGTLERMAAPTDGTVAQRSVPLGCRPTELPAAEGCCRLETELEPEPIEGKDAEGRARGAAAQGSALGVAKVRSRVGERICLCLNSSPSHCKGKTCARAQTAVQSSALGFFPSCLDGWSLSPVADPGQLRTACTLSAGASAVCTAQCAPQVAWLHRVPWCLPEVAPRSPFRHHDLSLLGSCMGDETMAVAEAAPTDVHEMAQVDREGCHVAAPSAAFACPPCGRPPRESFDKCDVVEGLRQAVARPRVCIREHPTQCTASDSISPLPQVEFAVPLASTPPLQRALLPLTPLAGSRPSVSPPPVQPAPPPFSARLVAGHTPRGNFSQLRAALARGDVYSILPAISPSLSCSQDCAASSQDRTLASQVCSSVTVSVQTNPLECCGQFPVRSGSCRDASFEHESRSFEDVMLGQAARKLVPRRAPVSPDTRRTGCLWSRDSGGLGMQLTCSPDTGRAASGGGCSARIPPGGGGSGSAPLASVWRGAFSVPRTWLQSPGRGECVMPTKSLVKRGVQAPSRRLADAASGAADVPYQRLHSEGVKALRRCIMRSQTECICAQDSGVAAWHCAVLVAGSATPLHMPVEGSLAVAQQEEKQERTAAVDIVSPALGCVAAEHQHTSAEQCAAAEDSLDGTQQSTAAEAVRATVPHACDHQLPPISSSPALLPPATATLAKEEQHGDHYPFFCLGHTSPSAQPLPPVLPSTLLPMCDNTDQAGSPLPATQSDCLPLDCLMPMLKCRVTPQEPQLSQQPDRLFQMHRRQGSEPPPQPSDVLLPTQLDGGSQGVELLSTVQLLAAQAPVAPEPGHQSRSIAAISAPSGLQLLSRLGHPCSTPTCVGLPSQPTSGALPTIQPACTPQMDPVPPGNEDSSRGGRGTANTVQGQVYATPPALPEVLPVVANVLAAQPCMPKCGTNLPAASTCALLRLSTTTISSDSQPAGTPRGPPPHFTPSTTTPTSAPASFSPAPPTLQVVAMSHPHPHDSDAAPALADEKCSASAAANFSRLPQPKRTEACSTPDAALAFCLSPVLHKDTPIGAGTSCRETADGEAGSNVRTLYVPANVQPPPSLTAMQGAAAPFSTIPLPGRAPERWQRAPLACMPADEVPCTVRPAAYAGAGCNKSAQLAAQKVQRTEVKVQRYLQHLVADRRTSAKPVVALVAPPRLLDVRACPCASACLCATLLV
jgi:hypothetical protein